MENKQRIVQKCIGNIEDRIRGVENDLKAFLYIRKNNLQHKNDNIGGGNIVVALSLFTCLNFLAKTYYCTVKPSEFNTDGSSKNETKAFNEFIWFVQNSGIDLGLPIDESVIRLVWRGFRNYLAHRLTVEPGKSVLTFSFEPKNKKSIGDILIYAKKHSVFIHDGSNRNWTLNCDSLLANLPGIVSVTTQHIKKQNGIDHNRLLKVIGVEYP